MKYLYIILLTLFVLFSFGCSDSSSPKASDEEILNDGWDNFVNGDLESALELFWDLVDDDALLAEAYCGIGWCLAYQGSLTEAIQNFTNALAEEPEQDLADDIYAGQCFSYEAQGSYQNCLGASDLISTNWIFEYDIELSYNDIILLRAICYFALADFENSLLEVQILDPDFEADVNTPEGRAALAAKIEELRGLV